LIQYGEDLKTLLKNNSTILQANYNETYTIQFLTPSGIEWYKFHCRLHRKKREYVFVIPPSRILFSRGGNEYRIYGTCTTVFDTLKVAFTFFLVLCTPAFILFSRGGE
jgi:hypothetical protein